MKRRLELLGAAALVAAGLTAAVAMAASSPAVTTGGHSHTRQTSVVLHGTVNPNGSATSYVFQWGLTTSYGVTGHLHPAGSGTKPVSATGTATHLIPGTVYHYRIVAFNKFGAADGRDRTFKTAGPPPPAATTGPATSVTTTSAILTGVINPNGGTTTWRFDYGLDTNYASHTTGGTVAGSSPPTTVSETIQGLTPGTIFHYRLFAQHGSIATTPGADGVFMTEPSPRPVPRIRARTTPHRDRHRPFTFTTSGRISGPSSIPATFGCASGQMIVRYFLGPRRVGFALFPLQPDCTFKGQTTFRHLPRRARRLGHATLNVFVRFRGNGYLASVRARREQIVLG